MLFIQRAISLRSSSCCTSKTSSFCRQKIYTTSFSNSLKERKAPGEVTLQTNVIGKWPKRKVALVIGYVGTKYSGLQLNDNPIPSIEFVLENALYKAKCIADSNHGSLAKIGWSRSSRTDKGVHCARMVISAKLLLKPDWCDQDDYTEFISITNSYLPPEIRIFSCTKVNSGFRARDACTWREYEYIFPLDVLTRESDDGSVGGNNTNLTTPQNDHVKSAGVPLTPDDALDRLNAVLQQFEGSQR